MNQRFGSFSAMRTSSTPRVDAPKYVSPTYRSSIFNHADGEDTAHTAPVRGIRTHQSFNRMSEDFTQSARGGWHTANANHTLPTVAEWIPKRHHINDPNAYDRVEEEAIVNAKKKAEQQHLEQKQRKEHLNREYNEVLASMEKKHSTRLDHKKPTHEEKRSYKETRDGHVDEILDKQRKKESTNKGLTKTLDQQIEEKVRQKQLELEKQRNDSRTGLDLKPRQQYDMNEHRDALKNQLEKNQSKKAQIELEKQQEKNERLRNLQEQEAIWTDYREKLAIRKTQSSESFRAPIAVHKVDLLEEMNKNNGLQGKPTINTRFSSTVVRNEASPEINPNHWEAVSKALLKRKEQQNQYLIDLKDQMVDKKKHKDTHHSNEKHEEKKQTGLKLAPYKPKESASEVVGVIKKQISLKHDVKKTEIKNKMEEKSKVIDLHKVHEAAIRQKYEETQQQKAEVHAFYQNSLSSSASKKKHGGLTVVKI